MRYVLVLVQIFNGPELGKAPIRLLWSASTTFDPVVPVNAPAAFDVASLCCAAVAGVFFHTTSQSVTCVPCKVYADFLCSQYTRYEPSTEMKQSLTAALELRCNRTRPKVRQLREGQ